MTGISYVAYPGGSDGDGATVSVYVGEVMVAGATCLRRRYDLTDPNRMAWHLVPTLRLPGVDGDGLRSVEVRDEAHARAWLAFLAGLYSTQAVGHEGVSADDEPPGDVITEVDIASEEISAAELDDDEQGFWGEVRDCCGGRSVWCSHFRQYPPVAVPERW